MRRAVGLLRFAAFLAVSWSSVSGQTAAVDSRPPQDVKDEVIYESFFRVVNDLKTLADNPEIVVFSGKKVTVRGPRLQDVVGLTDPEVGRLNSIAAGCVARLNSVLKRGPSIFESRLQRIESGEISPSLAKELQDVAEERGRIVLDSLKELKAALGDKDFRLLDEFVRSDRIERDLTPVVDPAASPDRN